MIYGNNNYTGMYPSMDTYGMQAYGNRPPRMPSQPALNGKIVDSIDIARVTEVPMGGYGVFPKADLSEIYIKSWDNSGNINLFTYKPINPEPSPRIEDTIMQKIESIENKLDSIIQPAAVIDNSAQTEAPAHEEGKKYGF